MTPPRLAAGHPAGAAAGWRERAAEACEKAAADGFTLDDVNGAGTALAIMADAALDLPLPGAGRTQERWSAMAEVAAVDVALGRLLEAHADAIAILAELNGPLPCAGQRWAVWAAEGPASTLQARPAGDDWRLDGVKPWCSGAIGCTHALVTAGSPEERALFAVGLQGESVKANPATWQATGLTGTATYTVTFDGARAIRVGEPGEYLTRPGFWHGGAGVAAVWWGAASGVAVPLYERVAAGTADAHSAAHLGAVEVALSTTAALLRETADDIDRGPQISSDRNAFRALRVRTAVEAAADAVLLHVARALGPAPLCQDREHARRVADLGLYIRQGHAERDLAQVGERAARRHLGAADA